MTSGHSVIMVSSAMLSHWNTWFPLLCERGFKLFNTTLTEDRYKETKISCLCYLSAGSSWANFLSTTLRAASRDVLVCSRRLLTNTSWPSVTACGFPAAWPWGALLERLWARGLQGGETAKAKLWATLTVTPEDIFGQRRR